MASAKIAISLPEELLRLIDLQCRVRGVSRSEFLRDAVSELIQRQEEHAAVGAYVAGYERNPEAEEEVRAALEMASAGLAHEGWE